MREIGRRYTAKEDGLLGTFGSRCSEKATSSAVKALPLWKRTFGRRRNSHTVGAMARHSVARPGTLRERPSSLISRSKMVSAMALLGESWW